MDILALKPYSYLVLFASNSVVIYTCFHCLFILSQTSQILGSLYKVFSYPT